MFDGFPGAGVERAGTSVPNYFDRVPLTDVFESVALYPERRVPCRAGRRRRRRRVDDGHAVVLHGAPHQAARGRFFTEDEGTPGKDKVVVLSHAFAARSPAESTPSSGASCA